MDDLLEPEPDEGSYPAFPESRWPRNPAWDEDEREQVLRRQRIVNSPALKWTPEADKAWEDSKHLVSRAVALSVPDWEGAADGSNPFVLWSRRPLYRVFENTPLLAPQQPVQ